MDRFKKGDKVRFDSVPDMEIDYLDGHVGTVVGIKPGNIQVRWNDPLPMYPYDDDVRPVTWVQNFSERYLTVVEAAEPEYDQETVNAILRHLRGIGWPASANEVERNFSKPKTRTVSVDFQVPEGESVVDYLKNVGIDYDIEGGN